MKFGIVSFPGSNCDLDMEYVLQDLLGLDIVHLWHKDPDLKGAEFIIIPGGFSYGDYLRSGAIAKLSPIMEQVMKHASKGGYVMGICNGFQVLTEAGMLDGALLRNHTQKFICQNVGLKPANTTNIITKDLDKDKAYSIPMAHGEGRFYAPEDTIKKLEDNNQIIFRYAGMDGTVNADNNPNGSINNIAGIQNKEGNVFALMPHPERAADPILGNTDGRDLLLSVINNCQ